MSAAQPGHHGSFHFPIPGLERTDVASETPSEAEVSGEGDRATAVLLCDWIIQSPDHGPLRSRLRVPDSVRCPRSLGIHGRRLMLPNRGRTADSIYGRSS